jgi:hypothetical protein
MEPVLSTHLAPPAAVAAPIFSPGEVIRQSFSIWRRNLVPLSVTALVLNLPVLVLNLSQERGQPPSGWTLLLNMVVGLAAGLASTGALATGALQALRGERPRVGHLVATGLGRIWRLLAVTFVGFWLVGVLGLVAAMVVGFATAIAAAGGHGLVVVIALGAVLGLFIGVMMLVVSIRIFVVVPVALEEPRLGALAAVRRARALTQGRRLLVFVVMLVIVAAMVVLIVPASLLVRAGDATFLAGNVVLTILGAVVSGLTQSVPVVAYQSLRLEKEGAGATQLSAVFE